MSKLARVVVVVTAVGGALLSAAIVRDLPDRSLRNLRGALTSGDEDALRAHVDFDALREHLKRQLLDSFTAAAPDARLAMAASRFVSPLVEGLVTPASLARLAEGKAADEHAAASWRGVDRADVVVRASDGRETRWLLERRGLAFVLVGIELPRELTGELERQWSLRLADAGGTSAADDAVIDESRARACAAWRKNALALLQALTQAQRTYRQRHERYAGDLDALGVPPVGGPDLYDLRVRRADAEGFVIEARGKGVMEGDALEADERGIRVLRDLCARATP